MSSATGMRRAATAVIAAAVVVSIAVTVATARSELPDLDWRLEPGWLALSFAGLVAFQWCHAEIWRRVVGTLGSHLDEVPAHAIWSVSLLGRYVPTSLLMPVIRVTMSADRGVPRAVAATSVVYELALTFSSAVVLGAWAIVSAPALEDSSWRFALLVAPVAVFSVLHPRVLALIAARLPARIGGARLVTLPLSRLLGFAVLYAAGFVVAGLSVAAFANALYPVEASDVPALVASYPVGFAFSLVAFIAPAGLGAREAALVAVAAVAVPVEVAVAVAVGTRLLQIVVELVYAGIARWAAPSSAIIPANGDRDPLT